MVRYKKPRVMMSWEYPLHRLCAKLSAYIIWVDHGMGHSGRDKLRLWNSLVTMYPKITGKVLGRKIEWYELMQEMGNEYGVKVLPDRVYQRADKCGTMSALEYVESYNRKWGNQECLLKT